MSPPASSCSEMRSSMWTIPREGQTVLQVTIYTDRAVVAMVNVER